MVSNTTPPPPALLARQALTVDDLAGGRLEVGLGSGYAPSDFAGVGRERIDGLAWIERFAHEVDTISALLSGAPVATGGDIDGATMRPPADPDDHALRTIAADGPAAIDVAARHADRWVSFGGWGMDTDRIAELTTRRAALLDERCAVHGRSPESVGRTLLVGSQAVNSDPLWTSVGAFEEFVGRFRSIGIDTFVVYWPPSSVSRDVDEDVVRSIVQDVLPRPPRRRLSAGESTHRVRSSRLQHLAARILRQLTLDTKFAGTLYPAIRCRQNAAAASSSNAEPDSRTTWARTISPQ